MMQDFWGSGHRGHGFSHWHAARHGHGWGRGGPFGGRRPGPADFFGEFFGPPPRAERGNVRYLVLDAIREQPRHGYEIIQAIEERSGGAYRPSPGVVYPTLQLLEELGHARVQEREARKVYAITDEGKKDLEAHADEVHEFYERSADDDWENHAEDFAELMRRTAKLFKTFKRAARRGHLSGRAKTQIRDVLDDAFRRIEAILAEQDR
jgi:DNA-binding PadR family transcriptional regulator